MVPTYFNVPHYRVNPSQMKHKDEETCYYYTLNCWCSNGYISEVGDVEILIFDLVIFFPDFFNDFLKFVYFKG
jgi:hypothetical protein